MGKKGYVVRYSRKGQQIGKVFVPSFFSLVEEGGEFPSKSLRWTGHISHMFDKVGEKLKEVLLLYDFEEPFKGIVEDLFEKIGDAYYLSTKALPYFLYQMGIREGAKKARLLEETRERVYYHYLYEKKKEYKLRGVETETVIMDSYARAEGVEMWISFKAILILTEMFVRLPLLLNMWRLDNLIGYAEVKTRGHEQTMEINIWLDNLDYRQIGMKVEIEEVDNLPLVSKEETERALEEFDELLEGFYFYRQTIGRYERWKGEEWGCRSRD